MARISAARPRTRALPRAAAARRAAAAALAALALAAAQPAALAQPSLSVQLEGGDPFVYYEDGAAVAVGQVRNLHNFPVTAVRVSVEFYLEGGGSSSADAGTVLRVIQPGSSSLYVARAPGPGAVEGAEPSLLSFNSAVPVGGGLSVQAAPVSGAAGRSWSGTVSNGGPADAEGVRVHAFFFDGFDPPRALGARTYEVPVAVPPGRSAAFHMPGAAPEGAAGARFVAESDSRQSPPLDVRVPRAEPLAPPVEIARVRVENSATGSASGHSAGDELRVTGHLALPAGGRAEYVYYAQVKESSSGHVVDLLEARGELPGPPAYAAWVPRAAGLYFVETYAWDPDGEPLGPPGPVALVLVR